MSYVVLTVFARPAVAVAQLGSLDDLPALFLAAGRILDGGDDARILLEDLQGQSTGTGVACTASPCHD